MVLDTGALILIEKRKARIYALVERYMARENRAPKTLTINVLEWWRGRTDRREQILRSLEVVPLSLSLVKLVGQAPAKHDVDIADAATMALAATTTGLVVTSDPEDLMTLGAFFPSVRVVAIS